jgi:superfamily II DNA/RNA helicase
MGFIPDIERIFKLTPFTRQTLFFSATMPPEITRLTEQFLQSPVRVEVAKPATTAATITARIVRLPGGDPRTRRAGLRAAIRACAVQNAIVFCNRKSDVDVVAKSLQRHGFNAAPIHGDLDQRFRMQTLDRFKSGEVPLLVASDVAARGLDIPAVSHVFNYEPPRHAEDYVHRIGRTGRAGRKGEAFTLIAPEDAKSLAAIERLIGMDIEAVEIEGAPDEALGDSRDRGGRGRRAEELKQQRSSRRQSGPRREGRGPDEQPEGHTTRSADAREPKPGADARRPDRARPTAVPPAEPGPRTGGKTGAGRRESQEQPMMGFGDAPPPFISAPTRKAQ